MTVYEFQTKANSYGDIRWASVCIYLSSWVSNQIKLLRRHMLILSLKVCKFMSFKQKRIFMEAFVESQFEVIYVYEFQIKANWYEDICWDSIWSYLTLWVENKSEFLRRHLSSLTLELCKFMSFKQKPIFTKTFVESQFKVMTVYEFQTKANSYEDIRWASVSTYLSLWISNKTKFFWWHLLSLSLELCQLISFKKKRVLMKTFFEFEFQVM